MTFNTPAVMTLLLLCCCFAQQTQAEIYQCRDHQGRASFSQIPCAKDQIEGDTEGHRLWREMQLLVNEGSAIYQLIGADIKSIVACKNSARAFSEKLELLEPRLTALPASMSEHLWAAQRSLKLCGQCQSSSPQHCQQATTQLNLQMHVLLPPLARQQP